jgi:hypothetical protein
MGTAVSPRGFRLNQIVARGKRARLTFLDPLASRGHRDISVGRRYAGAYRWNSIWRGSGAPNMECLSDRITESLVNSVSQLPSLKVMSRDSAFRYKGKDADAETVRQARNRLRARMAGGLYFMVS